MSVTRNGILLALPKSMALLKKLGYKDMGYLPNMESQVFGKWTTPTTELEIAQAINNEDNASG